MRSTHLTCLVNAPRTDVYRALVDPKFVAIWMVPDGMTSRVHEFDPREGGTFRISLAYDAPYRNGKSGDHTDTYHGYFAQLIRDELVVQVAEFETDDPAMQGEMVITFILTDAYGGTEIHATHDQLPPGLSEDDNETGWRMSLNKLAALVEANSA
jgi:uncharacterized protein YndB with AHSA1/START domain